MVKPVDPAVVTPLQPQKGEDGVVTSLPGFALAPSLFTDNLLTTSALKTNASTKIFSYVAPVTGAVAQFSKPLALDGIALAASTADPCSSVTEFSDTEPLVSDLPATDGRFVVCIRAVVEGVKSLFSTPPIVVKVTAPPRPSRFKVLDGLVASDTVNMTWEAVAEAKSYDARLCVQEDCSTSCFEQANLTGTSASFTVRRFVGMTACARAWDGAGNVGPWLLGTVDETMVKAPVAPGSASAVPNLPRISKINSYAAKRGEFVDVLGDNLTPAVTVTISGIAAPLTLMGTQLARFKVPGEVVVGMRDVVFRLSNTLTQTLQLIVDGADDGLPVVVGDPAFVCNDVNFHNADGAIVSGSRDCRGVSHPDCSDDGQIDCIATLAHRAFKVANLATKVVTGQTVAGVAGIAALAPPLCATDGQSSCIVDGTSFKAGAVAKLLAEKIQSGVSIGGVAGVVPARPPNCSATLTSACVTSAAFPSVSLASLTAEAGKVRGNTVMAGISGTLADCSSDGQEGCVVDGSVSKAARLANFQADKVRSGTSIAGIAGSYVVSPVCASDGATGCIASANFPAVDKDTTLSSANRGLIRADVTVAGVAGTMPLCAGATMQDCLANGAVFAATACTDLDSNCTLAAFHRTNQKRTARNTDAVTPGIVKAGASLLGVTGAYPSATYLLPIAAELVAPDLVDTTFLSQIASANGFGWFDRTGARFVSTGSADLVASNILSGKSIFGVVGTYAGAIFDPWDIRYGIHLGNTTGKLRTSCREGSFMHLSASDGFPGSDVSRQVTSVSTNVLTIVNHGFSNGDRISLSTSDQNSTSPTNATGVYWVCNATNDTFEVGTAADCSAVIAFNNSPLLTARRRTLAPTKWDSMAYIPLTETAAPQDSTVLNLTYQGYGIGDRFRMMPGLAATNALAFGTFYLKSLAPTTMSLALGGAALDWPSAPQLVALRVPVWPSENRCEGVEQTNGDDNVWRDVTTDGCVVGQTTCHFLNKITGLEWHHAASDQKWTEAYNQCDALTLDGLSGWRLPTDKEAVNLVNHGVETVPAFWNLRLDQIEKGLFWTNTAANPITILNVKTPNSIVQMRHLPTTYATLCVRGGG